MATYLTEHEAVIHAGVNEVSTLPSVRSWSSLEGGDVEAKTTQVHPGGLQPARALPGPSERTNMTVKRPMTNDLNPYVVLLENAAGKSRGWITWTLTDADGNPIDGSTVTVGGFLKSVQKPNLDAGSGNPAYLSLVYEVDAEATAN